VFFHHRTKAVNYVEGNTEISSECPIDGVVTVPAVDDQVAVSLSASVDAGWQKRGSGRCYNSLSGI